MPDEERRRHLIAVRLADEEFLPLQKIADKANLPMSRFVREGVRLVIKKYEMKQR